MISIFVDVSELVNSYEFDQRQIDDLLDFTVKEVTNRFAEAWINEANMSLKSARQEYISNINVVDEGRARGAVVLTGWLPNAVESGVNEFDIKEGLLSGPNAKTGQNGARYNTVPFSFGTPSALPENFSNIMPKEVYQVVKSKPFERTLKGGGVSTDPLKDSEIPVQFRAPKKKQVKLGDLTGEYTHKSSIFQGIRKQRDPVTKQNRYTSFRRVSDNSDPLSWIHPGIEARGLAERTLDNFDVPSHVGRIFDIWWENNF